MTTHTVYVAVFFDGDEDRYEVCRAKEGEHEGTPIGSFTLPQHARNFMEVRAGLLSGGRAHLTLAPRWVPRNVKDAGLAERLLVTCWTWLEED